MTSMVLRCQHLGRDISGLEAALSPLSILEGVRTPHGHDGCLEMHKCAVRFAMDRKLSAIHVVEDDCELTHHFDRERWSLDAAWAREHGYDVMVGGSTRTYDEKVIRPQGICTRCFPNDDGVSRNPSCLDCMGTGGVTGMIEVSAFHSAHCLVYFASGYEKALKAVQPYDWSLGRDCGMRCVLVYPFVAVQKPSFSGILQQQVDYVPLYEQHERNLGRQFT